MILEVAALAAGAATVASIVLVVGTALDDDRIRDPELEVNGEPVEEGRQ